MKKMKNQKNRILRPTKALNSNEKKGVGWPLIAGHVIECFDNTLYGFFAVMLAPLFFPSSSYAGQLLSSYGAFAAGYLARPLGALIFGSMGDKLGRRKPLLWSMGLVGIPTITIGLLPSYEAIGIIAPLLLVVCRLAQGVCMGAEFTGVNLYLAEAASKKALGEKTGILISSGVFGAIIATLCGALVTMEHMPKEGWRLPFILGGISAFAIFLFRRRLPETHDFSLEKIKESPLKSPWLDVFSKYRKNLVISCFIAGLTVMPLYLATIFGNRLFKELGYTQAESMMLNLVALVLNGILIIYCGKLADKVGFKRLITWGASTVGLIAIPSFILVSPPYVNTLNVYLFILILVSIGCIINGCAMPYIANLFPTKCRYSGMALSVTTGHALLGGTTPLIASFLTDLTGSRLSPGFWLVIIALLTTAGMHYATTHHLERS